jgi:general secretion pathway protein G
MKKQQGFTLLEIMVVVVIMGMLSAIVATNVMGSKEQASIEKAGMDIKTLDNALDMYKLDNHRFPTTEQGLDALVNKPTSSPEPKSYRKDGYIKDLPQDPWGNDYMYVQPGTHNSSRYDLYSLGPDGEDGTDDDIGNWKKDR